MEWGSRLIEYTLHLEHRQDLLVTVRPNLAVEVRAPLERQLDRIIDRIQARRSWIARQLGDFEKMSPLPAPRFISGETVLYLGREYRLKIVRGDRRVVLHAGRLWVVLPGQSNPTKVGAAVEGWFNRRAKAVFNERLSRLLITYGAALPGDPTLRVRRMRRRWGSCTHNGTITLHPALVQAPTACVDYVLVHELLHCLEPAHSARFYRLLGGLMPDWRGRRERLAKAAIRWV